MILVTGGTGLVGAHLLLRLAGSGLNVRALYRTEAAIAKTRNLFSHYGKEPLFDTVEWIQGDITDIPSLEDAVRGVEYIYHCAGFISYDPADEDMLRKINIEGTANMVNCALAFGIKKFCHVSSVAALGDTRDGEGLIDEETEWNPEKSHHDYALSKHGGEMEVWRAREEGLDVVIVNPGLIFGYGFPGQGSGQVFEAVKNGQYFYTMGNVGVVAVEDVADIMIRLMNSSVSGERFTVVAENMSIKRMFNTIADGLGKKHPGYYASPLLGAIGWRMDWLIAGLLMRKRRLTKAIAKSSQSRERFDNAKIIQVLNYRFISPEVFLKTGEVSGHAL